MVGLSWAAFDHARSDQLVAVVPRRELSGGDAPLGPVENEVSPFVADEQPRALQELAVADADGEPGALPGGQLPGGVRPVDFAGHDVQRGAPQPGVGVALADPDHVLHRVRGEDEQRLLAASDAESLALSDGVVMGAVVLADLLAVAHGVMPRFGQRRELSGRRLSLRRDLLAHVFRPCGEYFVDVALFRGELLLEEGRQVDLAHEADALRILAFGRGETLLLGDAPHLGFEQPADGKQRPAELLLRELAEEIALVLVGIAACEQLMDRPPVRQRLFRLAAVVARGHVVGAQLQRLAQEYVEFDFAVAQHVGIGRAAPFVFGEHVIHDTRAVVCREVDHVQLDVEFPGHEFGENPVVVPRTVAFERSRRVVPVDHKKPYDLMPLLLEEPGRHRRIDAARKSDYHPCHPYSNVKSPSGSTRCIVRPSKSMRAMNSSTAGTSTCRPPISSSNSGLASLS